MLNASEPQNVLNVSKRLHRIGRYWIKWLSFCEPYDAAPSFESHKTLLQFVSKLIILISSTTV